MASLARFGAMRRNLAEVADFVTVYIEEAHPAEKDHFKGNINIESHANMEDKMEAARTLKEEAGESLEGSPILVDPWDNPAMEAYAGFPERLYVILDGTIVYEGGMGPFGYKIEEVKEYLNKFCQKSK